MLALPLQGEKRAPTSRRLQKPYRTVGFHHITLNHTRYLSNMSALAYMAYDAFWLLARQNRRSQYSPIRGVYARRLRVEEEARAVQEVAKAAGKVVDAAREVGGFISRYVDGPLEQGIGIFTDHLQYMRWERQVRLMLRADEFLKTSGLSSPTRAIPLKLAIPLLQGATLEEDDELQDRWAVLLVNAANASCPVEIRRAHVAILEQLSSLEARILDVIYEIPFEQMRHEGVVTMDLPRSAKVASDPESTRVDPPEEVILALGNLGRLGCIKVGWTFGGGEHFGKVNPTMLGRSFVDACRLSR